MREITKRDHSCGGVRWKCFTCGGYWNSQSSTIIRQYATLTSPNNSETPVCGSPTFFAGWLGRWSLVATNRTLVPWPWINFVDRVSWHNIQWFNSAICHSSPDVPISSIQRGTHSQSLHVHNGIEHLCLIHVLCFLIQCYHIGVALTKPIYILWADAYTQVIGSICRHRKISTETP